MDKTEDKSAERVPVKLRDEIAIASADITIPWQTFIRTSQDPVLTEKGGGKGIGIYLDLLRDPHVQAVFRKRRAAVVAREWQVEPASDRPIDKQAADLFRHAISRIRFDHLCLGLNLSILTGYSVAEVLWEVAEWEGRKWIMPRAAKPKNTQRFVFDRDSQLRMLVPDNRSEGIPLPDRKFIVQVHGSEDTEDPYGLGLGATIFWYAFFKKNGVRFWMKFADKFSLPTLVGKHHPSATPDDKSTLRDAIKALANDFGIIVPEGTTIDTLETKMSGSASNGFLDLVSEMDGQISEAVLGERLTTNIGDTGSRSAGEVHNEVREELTDADCDLQSAVINSTLAKWLTEINLPGAQPPWFSRPKPDNDDLKVKVEIDKTLDDMGFEPDEEYINETYGGNRRKVVAPSPNPAAPAAPAFADEDAPTRDGIDDLADQAELAASAYMDELLGEIEQILGTSADFAEAQRRLTDLAEIIPRDQARVLAEAMVTANLTGRDDLTEGKLP
tara:strand:+ start:4861 stop:6363 length:1503 start_codon:yes stop_codon:yes gene_type:complete